MAQKTGEKKRVVIVGATGLQGGSVARTLAQSPDRFLIRGLTRNPSSSKAQALTSLNIEVQQADVDDPASLKTAFRDAHIIFAMTDFWQHMSATREEEQGKSIVDIAAELPQLETFIWAGLPDANTISGGVYPHVYHWQSKAAVTKYIKEEKPELWKKTTAVLFPNYLENCVTQPGTYLPIKQGDGTYLRSFVLPESTPLPNVAISDTGKLIQYILDHPDKCLEKEIAFYSEAISEGQKIRDMASAYGIDIRYNELSSEEFQGNLRKHMSDITALDFAEQLLIFRDFGMIYERPEFVQANQLPGLKLTTWKEFMETNDLHSYMTSA
ncbi:uncharacterized protein B0J16DRAFT_376534 [Fusarium flagelliforme]|uniref:NmrA-like domain-containing protein n=1 Tax=Fusarium flagelliforme TaxID=2675880 RepID=A0A395MM37_9HYPO|nr:uncharacterized protein B0J16DRAFT_376534 [Fusarium flagelliforme]KAH7173973.1 hypothetical protein B0J16DRAFT_376534 [Fusarium flagelliforme]RFN48972.1 hypothetical protein FIE12Z_6820 [Fusarium flagelliforme]